MNDDDGIDSDHTDTDYQLESAVRHALKNNEKQVTFEDLGTPLHVALLSPSAREIVKNLELIRLPLVELRSRKAKILENEPRTELWPGVACGGAAVRCIHCEDCRVRVLYSMLELCHQVAVLTCYHFPQCKNIPSEKLATIQSIVSKVNPVGLQMPTELSFFCKHISENLQHNSRISVPFIGTHRPTRLDVPIVGERSRVTDLEELVYQKRMNGKIRFITKVMFDTSYISSAISKRSLSFKKRSNNSITPKNHKTAAKTKTVVNKSRENLYRQTFEGSRSKNTSRKKNNWLKRKSLVIEVEAFQGSRKKN